MNVGRKRYFTKLFKNLIKDARIDHFEFTDAFVTYFCTLCF